VSLDDPFFVGHLEARARGLSRDVRLFRALCDALNVELSRLPPTIVVVGSKGKGTCTAAASQYLSSLDKTVVTVSSPHYVSARERLRVNGALVDESIYKKLSTQLDLVLQKSPHLLYSPHGYLSPVGRFLAIACLLTLEINADFLVAEAGMGGWSDEVSELPFEVLAATSIFEEHIGLIGDTVGEIAVNKLYPSFSPSAKAVVTLRQNNETETVLDSLREWGRQVEVVNDSQLLMGPDPYGPMNASLGYRAAQLLTGCEESVVDNELWTRLKLPARNQLVELGDRQIIVSSAATLAGLTRCLEHEILQRGPVDSLVLCIPDDRDPDGISEVLAPNRIVWARSNNPKFNHRRTTPMGGAELVHSPSLGRRVFVSGVIGFAGEVLRHLSVSPDDLRWWD
jgi:folylpolyglutamate synthase/dihydropteroate synthase